MSAGYWDGGMRGDVPGAVRGAILPVSRRCRTYRLTVDKPARKVRAAWLLLMSALTAARIFRRTSEEYAFILHYRKWANVSH